MATWSEVAADAPAFAERVRERFEAGTNKTIATLRRDGSPRISGTELAFDSEQVTLGMMPGSRKLHDVLRDPRVAIHSPTLEPPTGDPSAWLGDAKLIGRLAAIVPPQSGPDGSYFAVEISAAVLTYVEGDELVVESWHEGRGWQRVKRT